jgi:hypothetical protein
MHRVVINQYLPSYFPFLWCRLCEFCLSKNSIHLNYSHLLFIKIDNSLLELDVQYWCTTSTWCGCYGVHHLLIKSFNIMFCFQDGCLIRSRNCLPLASTWFFPGFSCSHHFSFLCCFLLEFCLSKNSIHLNYCHLQFIKIDNSLLELDVRYWCTTSTWRGYGGTPWYISLFLYFCRYPQSHVEIYIWWLVPLMEQFMHPVVNNQYTISNVYPFELYFSTNTTLYGWR